MQKVIKYGNKKYDDSKKSYASYYRTGYLRLPADAKRRMKYRVGTKHTDIYIDEDNKQVVLVPCDEGAYTLSDVGAGVVVCLSSVRDCGIEVGKHNYELSTDEYGLLIKIDFASV